MAEPASRRDHLYGGQALIEGVMMRGKDVWAVAVRRADEGIHTEAHDIDSVMSRHPILAKPGFRGVIALGQAMAIGYRALMIAANETQPEDEKLEGWQMGVSMVVALTLFVVVFMLLPLAGARYTQRHWIDSSLVVYSLEGIFRVGLFVGYLFLIGRMKDIQRVFQYHGAEHKTIAAYEHEEELEPANIDKYSTLHVRCGTNFLMIVMLVAIIFFTSVAPLLSGQGVLVWVASRILGIPLIAAVSYEMLRLGAKFEDSRTMKILMAPGLWLQMITTKPPDHGQIEIAIASFNAVLVREAEKVAGDG